MGSRARGEHHQVPTSDLDTGKAHHPSTMPHASTTSTIAATSWMSMRRPDHDRAGDRGLDPDSPELSGRGGGARRRLVLPRGSPAR